MSNVWLPVPVALFVRRVANVLSSLSITHHYLLPPRSTDTNGIELPTKWATRVQRSNGRHEAERRVSWLTIVKNSLDDLLQGAYTLDCKTIVEILTFLRIHSTMEDLYTLVLLARASLAPPIWGTS